MDKHNATQDVGISDYVLAECRLVSNGANRWTSIRRIPRPAVGASQTITIPCGGGEKVSRVVTGVYASSPESTTVLWGAPGFEYYKPATSSDPLRTWECTVTASDGQIYKGESVPFRESTAANPTDEFPQPVCPKLPAGVNPISSKILEKGGGETHTVWEQEITQQEKDFQEEFGTVCGAQSCLLDLVVKADGLSCFGKEDACDGWASDADRESKYECRYGNKAQALSECFAYAQIFNLQNRLSGAAYADPATGEKIKSGGTSRSIDEGLMGAGARPAGEARNCFGGGWSAANPLEWVFKPLQCAAEWAFVPRMSVVLGTQATVTRSWDNTVFGQIGTVTAPLANIPVWTGCSGLPVKANFAWPRPWGIDWQLGAACSGPLNIAANVTRTVSGALVAGGGLLALSSYLGWGIGFRGFGRSL
jgi:hypothetical protein